MEIDITALSGIALVGVGGYFAWWYLNPMDGAYYFNQIEARTKEEFEGYMHGIKKASSSKEAYLASVDEWYKYWITKRADLLNFLVSLRTWAISQWA